VPTNYEASRPPELSEAELTAVLAAANDDLMDHVSTCADPAAALLAIMDGRSYPSVRKQPADAAAVIKMRSMARTLAGDLDSHIERANVLGGGIERADGRARMLVTALSGPQISDAHLVHTLANALYFDVVHCANDLVQDLSAAHDVAIDLMDRAAVYVDEIHAGTAEFADVIARTLDGIRDLRDVLSQSCALASHLGVEIARRGSQDINAVRLNHAQRLAYAYDSLRIRVRDTVDDLHLATVLNPARELAWIQIDASGVDLSGALFHDLDDLIGVIWTSDTTWPHHVVNEVRARSDEVGPGIYKVRGYGLEQKYLATV